MVEVVGMVIGFVGCEAEAIVRIASMKTGDEAGVDVRVTPVGL